MALPRENSEWIFSIGKVNADVMKEDFCVSLRMQMDIA